MWKKKREKENKNKKKKKKKKEKIVRCKTPVKFNILTAKFNRAIMRNIIRMCY